MGAMLGNQKLLLANIDNIYTVINNMTGYDANYANFTPSEYYDTFGITLASLREFIKNGSPFYSLYQAGITDNSLPLFVLDKDSKSIRFWINQSNNGWKIDTRAGGGEGKFVYCNEGVYLTIQAGNNTYDSGQDIFCNNKQCAAALYEESSIEETFSRTVDIYCLATDKSKNLFYFRVRVDASGHLYEDIIAIDQQRVVKFDSNLVSYCSDLIEITEDPIEKEPWIMSRFSPRVATSGIGVYPLTTSQVTELLQDLWSTSFTEAFNMMVLGDPVKSIMSLRWFYGFTPSDFLLADGQAYVKIGNVPFTGSPTTEHTIITTPCKSEFASKTLSIHCPEKYGNYLDLEPYTKVQLWVPYAGWQELNPNEVMGADIDLEYNINLTTGAASCNIYVRNNPRMQLSGVPIANVNCELSMDIPVSVDRMQNASLVGATVAAKSAQIGFAAGSTFAGGAMADIARGASALNAAASALPSNTGIDMNSQEAKSFINAKNYWGTRLNDDFNRAPLEMYSSIASAAQGNIANLRPSFSRASGMSVETANLNIFRPMLIITHPKKLTPEDISDYFGNKSVKSCKLSECSGFTQIGAIKSVSSVVPGKYMNKIEGILKAGVFINKS